MSCTKSVLVGFLLPVRKDKDHLTGEPIMNDEFDLLKAYKDVKEELRDLKSSLEALSDQIKECMENCDELVKAAEKAKKRVERLIVPF